MLHVDAKAVDAKARVVSLHHPPRMLHAQVLDADGRRVHRAVGILLARVRRSDAVPAAATWRQLQLLLQQA